MKSARLQEIRFGLASDSIATLELSFDTQRHNLIQFQINESRYSLIRSLESLLHMLTEDERNNL